MRQTEQISALSPFVCRVVAYIGNNGYGGCGIDPEETALETAITSMDGSSRATCPISNAGGGDEQYIRCPIGLD